MSQGYIKQPCDPLLCKDLTIVAVCLEGLGSIFKSGKVDWVEKEVDLDPYSRMTFNARVDEKLFFLRKKISHRLLY